MIADKLKSACLAATVVGVAAAPTFAEAQAAKSATVQVAITILYVRQAYFFHYVDNSSFIALQRVELLPDVTGSFATAEIQVPEETGGFGFMAVYQNGSDSGLVVATQTQNYGAGRTFTEAFSGFNEGDLVNAFFDPDNDFVLDDFFLVKGLNDPYGYMPGSGDDELDLGYGTYTLTAFSTGAPAGSVNIVPEPASLAAMGFGLVALLRRRRG